VIISALEGCGVHSYYGEREGQDTCGKAVERAVLRKPSKRRSRSDFCGVWDGLWNWLTKRHVNVIRYAVGAGRFVRRTGTLFPFHEVEYLSSILQGYGHCSHPFVYVV
jgi:hypothetical protein